MYLDIGQIPRPFTRVQEWPRGQIWITRPNLADAIMALQARAISEPATLIAAQFEIPAEKAPPATPPINPRTDANLAAPRPP